MKKILITFLAVLLLVSFTSCNSQEKIDKAVTEKAEEIAEEKEALISFRDTLDAISPYQELMEMKTASNEAVVAAGEYDLSDTNTNTKLIYDLLYQSNKSDYIAFSQAEEGRKIEKSSGTVVVERTDNSWTLTFKSVDITASYTPGTGSSDATIKATLKLDGVIYIKASSDEEGNTSYEGKVTGFAENGTSYKDIECSVTYSNDDKTSAYTKAICNGVNVDLDILNKFM